MKSKWIGTIVLLAPLLIMVAGEQSVAAINDSEPLTAEGYDGPPLIWPFPMGHNWKVLSGGGYNTPEHGGGHWEGKVFYPGELGDKFTFDLQRADDTDSYGQEVYAAQDGEITANWILRVKDANGNLTNYYVYYGHMASYPHIQRGTDVSKGQPLGTITYNEYGTPAHLHFGIAKCNESCTKFPNAGWVPIYFQNICGQSYTFHEIRNEYAGTVITPCLDVTPPNILVSDPPEEEHWYNISQPLSWTISDDESGVDKYEWWWEGQSHQLEDPAGNPGMITGSAQLHDAGQGKTWLHVKAWSGAGRDRQEDIGWFGYDTIPPNIVFSSSNPPTGHWYNTSETLSWEIHDPGSQSDSGSGVDYFKWEWDDSSPGRQKYSDQGSTTLSAAGQGRHTLYVQAWDIATNASAIQDGTLGWFGYDIIPPNRPSIREVGCRVRNNQWQNRCLDPSFTWSAMDRDGDEGSGVSQYAYAWGRESSVSSANWSSWSIATTYDPGLIDVVDGWAQYFLHVKSRDVAGNESSPATFGFWYDGSDPTITGFAIDRGASTTNKTNVRLDVTASDTASGVAAICLNDNGGACSDWRSYAGDPLFWTLTALNHYTHTLYAAVRDAAGNESGVASDTIYMDLDPPMPHSANYRICQYVVNQGGLERITSTHYSLASAIGQPWVTGADVIASTGFVARAGFLSGVMGCLPISYTHAPALPVFITPTLSSSFEVSISDGEGFYTNDSVVEIRAPAPNVARMRISGSSTYSSTGWQTYQLTTTWTISAPVPSSGNYTQAGDYDYSTPHYIYVWFLDDWGNVYGPYFDLIFYDPIAPEGEVELIARGVDTVTLSLEAWDDNSGVVEMRIGEAPTFEGSSWQSYKEVVDWIPTASGPTYVQFRDGAGNTSRVYALELRRQIYLPVIFKLSS